VNPNLSTEEKRQPVSLLFIPACVPTSITLPRSAPKPHQPEQALRSQVERLIRSRNQPHADCSHFESTGAVSAWVTQSNVMQAAQKQRIRARSLASQT